MARRSFKAGALALIVGVLAGTACGSTRMLYWNIQDGMWDGQTDSFNRFVASAELNGEKIAPPKWKRPGLKNGNPIADWTPAWTLYEADEEPFTDQEYYMREPTQIFLRKGWNHVKLTIPNPSAEGKTRHRWSGTFIPVAGSTDHPHEVSGLEYSSDMVLR